jgi:hypothetical protein
MNVNMMNVSRMSSLKRSASSWGFSDETAESLTKRHGKQSQERASQQVKLCLFYLTLVQIASGLLYTLGCLYNLGFATPYDFIRPRICRHPRSLYTVGEIEHKTNIIDI